MPSLKKPTASVGNAKEKKAAAKDIKASDRKVVYSTFTSEIAAGDSPITEDRAKELLGWEDEGEKNPFGNKHVDEISRIYGNKVRCSNNTNNRSIDLKSIAVLKQEILRNRWRFNGEPIIIGKSGLVLNGQHTLFALILAVKAWRDAPDSYPEWKTEPTLEKMIVFGVSEDDQTVNTMDTCKSRSLSDVIFRSYFKNLTKPRKKVVSKMAEHTIRMLWKRTGIHINALGVRQTHAESIAYFEMHPRISKAVQHIYEENDDDKLSKYLSPGYMSAALYLMGCSASDHKAYYTADDPSEKQLDWKNWDKACEFFVSLAAGDKKLDAVRQTITTLLNQNAADWKARWSVLTKAWNLYLKNKPITPKLIMPKFEVKDDASILVDEETLGGIDVGSHGLEHEHKSDPSPTDIEKGAAKAKDKKFGKATLGKKAGLKWAKGDTAWVHSKNEDAYFAELKVDPYETMGEGGDKVMVESADGEWEVNVSDLSLKQFEKVA